jgi:DinB superfamily
MSQDKQHTLLQELNATADGFLKSLDGVPADRWTYSPSPDIWSVSQTAEHTTTVFRGVQRLLATKLLDQPFPPGTRSPVTDEAIVMAMFDRSLRTAAPQVVIPKGRWATREELSAAFIEAREQLVRWFNDVTVDLRGYQSDHLVIGTMDGVQWLIFVAAHTERHTRQILEFRRTQGW